MREKFCMRCGTPLNGAAQCPACGYEPQHDAYEVPAHVAEDPNALERPSAGPKQVVVSHRPEAGPVSLADQMRETASAAPAAQPPAETATAAAEPPKPEKQEAPRRRSRFRIGS